MGLKSRNKGKRGELEACNVLRALFPDVRRKAMQSRGGSEGADLENTDHYHVEVGIGGVNPRRKFEQACADAELTATPLALTRSDRGVWLVTISAYDFADLELCARETRRGKLSGPTIGGTVKGKP